MKLIIIATLLCGALAGGYKGYGHGGHANTNVRYGGYGHQAYGYEGYGHAGYGHGGYKGLYQKVSSHYGNTAFAYNDGLSTREEHIAYDGSRIGSYSVMGADGELRTVRYKAGKDGFQLLDDSGVVNWWIIIATLLCGALAGGYKGYGHGGHANTNVRYGGYGHQAYGYEGYGHAGYGHGGYKGLYQKVSSHYGNTAFAYNDGLSTREEHIAYDGSRFGSYSVMGADGELRTVRYKAGKDGFQLLDDSGVVTEDNVARAAELAKLAPKTPEVPEVPDVPDVPEVPEVPEVDLPVAPTNPPDYGKRNEKVYNARKHAYTHGHRGGYYGGFGYGHGAYGYGKAYGHGYGYAAPKSYGYSVKTVAPVKKAVYSHGYGHGHGYGGYGYAAPVSYGYSVKRVAPVSYGYNKW